MDPERSHRLVFCVLAPVQRYLERAAPRAVQDADRVLHQRVCGMDVDNPIGLAAGFDKNAELPHVWDRLGFGFAELGTITAEPQSGNPRPRLFRLPADHALINRLGFNNGGADAVTTALARRFRHVRPTIPYGINVGKSRVTPLDTAPQDYVTSLRRAFPLADYIAINVSSPNTPGLRELQSAPQLEPLLAALRADNQRLAREHNSSPRPLFLKIAPEMTPAALRALVDVAARCHISGFIATNTTTERPLLRAPAALAAQDGGLSGAPLRDRSTTVIRELFELVEGRFPIIGVGGIFSAEDAYAKIRAGATLVQIYTGFVYEGPALAMTLCAGVQRLLARDGHRCVADAVGADVRAAA
jgi:dihydroorotate dehydrogenase